MQTTRLLAALAAFLFAAAATAADESTLRWTFREGDSFRYRTEERTTLGDEKRGMKVTLVLDATWRVLKTNGDSAIVGVTIDRLQFNADGDVTGEPFEYRQDTRDGTAEGRAAALHKPHFAAFVGPEYRLSIDGLGRVGAVTLPEPLAERLGTAFVLELEGFFGDTIGAPGVVRHLKLPAVALPQEAASANTTWSREFRHALPAKFTFSGTSDYSYAGREERGGTAVHRIHVEAEEALALPGGKGALNSKGKGAFLFDAAAGRVLEGKVSLGGNSFRESTFEVKQIPAE